MCGGSWDDHTLSSASYELCHDGVAVVGVYAVGETPGDPSVTHFGDATWSAFEDSLSVPVDGAWSGEGAGASTTIWFGAFGPDGAFSGWTSDEAVLPLETHVMRQDRKPGVAEDTTPTQWGECPTGDWIVGAIEPFGEPAPEDTGVPATVPKAGCSSTGHGPAGGFGLLALGLVRRRRGWRFE